MKMEVGKDRKGCNLRQAVSNVSDSSAVEQRIVDGQIPDHTFYCRPVLLPFSLALKGDAHKAEVWMRELVPKARHIADLVHAVGAPAAHDLHDAHLVLHPLVSLGIEECTVLVAELKIKSAVFRVELGEFERIPQADGIGRLGSPACVEVLPGVKLALHFALIRQAGGKGIGMRSIKGAHPQFGAI